MLGRRSPWLTTLIWAKAAHLFHSGHRSPHDTKTC